MSIFHIYYGFVKIDHIFFLFFKYSWWTFPYLFHNNKIRVFRGFDSTTFNIGFYRFQKLFTWYYFFFQISFFSNSYSVSSSLSSSSCERLQRSLTVSSSATLAFMAGIFVASQSTTITSFSIASFISRDIFRVRTTTSTSFSKLLINIFRGIKNIKYYAY